VPSLARRVSKVDGGRPSCPEPGPDMVKARFRSGNLSLCGYVGDSLYDRQGGMWRHGWMYEGFPAVVPLVRAQAAKRFDVLGCALNRLFAIEGSRTVDRLARHRQQREMILGGYRLDTRSSRKRPMSINGV
jgi:hypothetical protein